MNTALVTEAPRKSGRAARAFSKRAFLQIYRLAVLVAIAWLIRAHSVRLRVEGHAPISLEEVRPVFPTVAALRPDPGERAGMFVQDAAGRDLGYVLRTAPVSDSIVGYRGWTDSLIAFDGALKVLGVRIHASQDTREHVEDIRTDRGRFLKTWNGRSWEEVARVTPEQAGIEGVSGATMTSMAIAEAVMRRLRSADAALAIAPPPWRFRLHDAGLLVVIAAAWTLAVTGTHGKKWMRRGFQIFVIGYVGFLSGDLVTQSLVSGWAQAGVPWRSAPGLVLLVAAALAVPWGTGKPLYCQHICPHGAAQELLGRMAPRRWRIALKKDFAAGLRWMPALLLGVVIVVTFLGLPIELAHLEPFDAYVWKTAGVATIVIAIAGLIASLFVPMAYCHYGCPTGALLSFVRSRGSADQFGLRDLAALLLVGLAAVLSWKFQSIHEWLTKV